MRRLFILATLFAPASSNALPAASPPIAPKMPQVTGAGPAVAKLDCASTQVRHADGFGSARPRRLDQMPPGKLYLSVMRQVDGCQELVLVSEERGRLGKRR